MECTVLLGDKEKIITLIPFCSDGAFLTDCLNAYKVVICTWLYAGNSLILFSMQWDNCNPGGSFCTTSSQPSNHHKWKVSLKTENGSTTTHLNRHKIKSTHVKGTG